MTQIEPATDEEIDVWRRDYSNAALHLTTTRFVVKVLIARIDALKAQVDEHISLSCAADDNARQFEKRAEQAEAREALLKSTIDHHIKYRLEALAREAKLQNTLAPFAKVGQRMRSDRKDDAFTEVLEEMSYEEDAALMKELGQEPTKSPHKRAQVQHALDSLQVKHWRAAAEALSTPPAPSVPKEDPL